MSQKAVELLAALYFLIIGLSHVFHPHAWVDFFTHLRNQGRTGMFAEGFLALSLGALIVAFHNVWSGLPMLLTIIGWGQVGKASIRFLAPTLSLRVYERVSHERAWHFRVAGFAAVGVGFLLLYLFLGAVI